MGLIQKTGGCFPLEWQCDGIVQCPNGDDELGCVSFKTPLVNLNWKPVRELYTSHTYVSHRNYPRHYFNNDSRRQTFKTSKG